ncbi:MAG: rRNA (cytidine-2'-O-)-methyltransferase, partial [Patescibacteria group bacterium]
GEKRTAVLLESSHRIQKTIRELSAVLLSNQRVCVMRELTKKFETVYRGTLPQILAMDIAKKGEFVIVIEGSGRALS